jgi:putative nucleotidyltransferase with HDIG domain
MFNPFRIFKKPAPTPRKKARLFANLTRWAVLVAIFAAIVIIVSPSFYFHAYEFKAGERIGTTIKAPFPFEVKDREATQKRLEEAELQYKRIYQYDSTVEDKILERLDGVLGTAVKIKASTEIPAQEKPTRLGQQLSKDFGLTFSDSTISMLLKHANDARFKTNLATIINHVLDYRGVMENRDFFETLENRGIVEIRYKANQPPEPLTAKRILNFPDELNDYLQNRYIPQFYTHHDDREAVFNLCDALIQPNIKFLEDETNKTREAYLAAVKPVTKTFQKGEVVIQTGSIVSDFHRDAIQTLNSYIRYHNFLRLLANIAFVAAVFVFTGFFVRKFKPDFAFTAPNVILVSLPVLLALFLGRMFLIYLQGEEIGGYAFPAGVIGMLGVILLDARLAVLLVTWGSLLFGLSVDFDFKFIIVALLGGYTAVTSLYTIKERKDILMAGFSIALVNFFSILVVNFIVDPTQIKLTEASWGIVNGIACAFIALPALPLFEYLFGIITDVRLLELTGIHQPLLRELEEKAPGSYQHSLNVAKLAEPAAMAIGANYLLVRAGAYYHDVGKMIKPKYYSENQTTPEDKKTHTKLTPHMSVLVIKNHIKEGMELAIKYGIPKKVRDFIPQHHGTSLIRYFYQQALENYENSESNDPVHEEDFLYPGPKPQTIEAAIVMLADAVEATATSKASSAYVKESDLRRIVRDAIVEKFNGGQFDECNLTLKDLHIISESFVKTLISRFHFRIAYPAKKETVENSKPELSQIAQA